MGKGAVIPITLFNNWVSNFISNEKRCLGIWYPSNEIQRHFCNYNQVTEISTKSFKRRMNTICSLHKHVYKKECFIASDKKYITYYLIISDRNFSDQHIEDVFTQHSHHIHPDSNFSNNYAFTKQSSHIQPTQAINSTISTTTTIQTSTSKWVSPEALKYFMPKIFSEQRRNNKDGVSNQHNFLAEHLRLQMKRFRDGWLTMNGWKKVLEDGDHDGLYTESDIFRLRLKCMYLFHSTDQILKSYHKFSITNCVDIAICKIEEFALAF